MFVTRKRYKTRMKMLFISLVTFFSISLSEGSMAGTTFGNPETNNAKQNPEILQTRDFWQRAISLSGESSKVWKAACCKICRKGKACGNSCIKTTYTCRKGSGCACDG